MQGDGVSERITYASESLKVHGGWWWREEGKQTHQLSSSNSRRGNTLLCWESQGILTLAGPWGTPLTTDRRSSGLNTQARLAGKIHTRFPGISPTQQLRGAWGKPFCSQLCVSPPARSPRTLITEWRLSQSCSGWIAFICFSIIAKFMCIKSHSLSLHEGRMGMCVPIHTKHPDI